MQSVSAAASSGVGEVFALRSDATGASPSSQLPAWKTYPYPSLTMIQGQEELRISPTALPASPSHRSIARGMLWILLGGLFVVIDLGSKQYQRVEQTASDGTSTSQETGWQWDLVPDEIGHLLIGLAFFNLAAAAQGSVRTWLKALGWWQLVMILIAMGSHRIDQVVVTEITEYGSRSTTKPSWIGAYVVHGVSALHALGEVAAGWCLAKLCRTHDLLRSAQLWTRYAWLVSAVTAFCVVSGAFFLMHWFSQPGEAVIEAVPYLAQHSAAFAVLAVATLIVSVALWLHACIGTRAEAVRRLRQSTICT